MIQGNLSEQYEKNRLLKLKQKKGDIPMMKANLDPSVDIKVQDKHMLHVRLTRKVHNKAAKSYDEHVHIAKFHKRNFDRMGSALKRSYDSQVIVHDPERGETVDTGYMEVKNELPVNINVESAEPEKMNPVVVYSRYELEEFGMGDLRDIAEPYGVKDTAKDRLIDKILEAQK